MNKALAGAAVLRDYVAARNEAQRLHSPLPKYPNVTRCTKCKWPGHSRPKKGVCPLHPGYTGLLPKCHFNREEAKNWVLFREKTKLEEQARVAAAKPHECSMCKRRFRTLGKMTSCRKKCTDSLQKNLSGV